MDAITSAKIIAFPTSSRWLTDMSEMLTHGNSWDQVPVIIEHCEPWQRDRWQSLWALRIVQGAAQ